jgi:cytochrome c oxidase subunit 4
MVGTIITVGVAFIDLGIINTPLALVIACCKGTLVVLFFMHVKYSHPLIWVSAASGFFFLAILFIFTFNDYVSRDWEGPAPIEFLQEGTKPIF